jgi:protein-L-isoaspartate(D-aspartate) O-methyltransferase
MKTEKPVIPVRRIQDYPLDMVRRFYSEEVRLAAQVTSPRLIEAFSRVPRENYLGPGPWRIAAGDLGSGGATYMMTDDDDPRHVYHNVPIALDVTRDLNNGQPGTLARWMDALALQPGHRVFHLGCGSGYYTAILAETVGPQGHVCASEVDPDLAARSRENLQPYDNVDVHAGDGAVLDPGPCESMLINAGVTHTPSLWLDRLVAGGRMIVPLTIAMGSSLGKGVIVIIENTGAGFSARLVTFVMIYSCLGARNPQFESLLGKALATGAFMKLRSVRRAEHEISASCLLHGQDICMSSADPAA